MRTQTKAQSAIVFGLAALFLACGTVLLVDLLTRPQWPSLVFLPLLGVGLTLLALGFWARHHPDAWLARHSGYVSGAFVGVLAIIVASSVGREQVVVHEMKWSYGEPSPSHPDTHVILTYCTAPDHYEEFFSSELARFLVESRQPTVEVELVVTRDFGNIRGFSIRRIGPFVNTNFGWAGGGCQGPCEGAPREGSRLTSGCS